MTSVFQWQATGVPPAGRYDDIWHVTADKGWAVNSNGEVLHTTNGWQTWEVQLNVNSYLRCIAFADEMKGWLGTTTESERMYSTVDGGANWSKITNLPNQAPVKICGLSVVTNTDVIFASGTNVPGDTPGVIKSIDGGQSWQGWDMAAHADILIDCLFLSEMVGWVTGGKSESPNPTRANIKPVVLFTEDGGESWTNQLDGQEPDFPLGEWGWKIQFLDDQTGFISLENFFDGAILVTQDAGANWKRKKVNDLQQNKNLEGIGFISAQHGWVGGWGDVSFSTGKSSATADGGNSWQDANEIGRFINRFRFSGDPVEAGYASGRSIYRYSNQPVQPIAAGASAAPSSQTGILDSGTPAKCAGEHSVCVNLSSDITQLEIRIWDRFADEVTDAMNVDVDSAGHQDVTLILVDRSGNALADGHYIYRVTAGEKSESRILTIDRTSASTVAPEISAGRETAKQFWYDFDNQTLWRRSRAISDALQRGYFQQNLTLDSLPEMLRTSIGEPDHPAGFLAAIHGGKQGLLDLAAIQLQLFDRHLNDDEMIQRAFEFFGQGVLFDDRAPRPPSRHVHMMDGTPDTWVGYQRWHGFMRAAALLGEDAQRWLHLNRCLALAWAIHTEADPEEDNPGNPGLSEARLQVIRDAWMDLDATQLECVFAKHRFRAPTPDQLSSVSWLDDGSLMESFTYQQVQQILESAAGNGHPIHGGHERFWLLPLEDFLQLPPIFGHQLIAEPGPDRGARSALVKVLKGTLAGVPRMPLNQQAISAEQIDYIEKWIDSLD